MQHMFDIDIAVEYGVDQAIFLKNLAYWVVQNKANDINFYDGRYWTFNSIKAFSELFPYWTPKQIRTIINKCLESDLILKGDYNEKKYDKTSWYTLSDKGLELFRILICPNGQKELPKRAKGVAQKGEPIPNIKPDIKQDKKQDQERGKKRHSTRTNIPDDFEPNESHELLSAQLHLDIHKEKDAFVDYYKAHGKKMINWNSSFSNWLRKSKQYRQRFEKKEHPITSAIRDLKESSPEFRDFLLS